MRERPIHTQARLLRITEYEFSTCTEKWRIQAQLKAKDQERRRFRRHHLFDRLFEIADGVSEFTYLKGCQSHVAVRVAQAAGMLQLLCQRQILTCLRARSGHPQP